MNVAELREWFDKEILSLEEFGRLMLTLAAQEQDSEQALRTFHSIPDAYFEHHLTNGLSTDHEFGGLILLFARRLGIQTEVDFKPTLEA